MSRHSSNFQLTQIFDPTQMSTLLPTSFNDFGNFIYKDHVTRKQYNVDHLKSSASSFPLKQTLLSSFTQTQTHKQNRSTDSMPKIKSKFANNKEKKDEMETRKWELSHFLEELEMMNKIRTKRNHIVSGAEKAQSRKSYFPMILPSLLTQQTRKEQNIDLIKQQIRKQVNELSTELFREYMQKKQPYRMVFNELNTASNKGALNTNKIKEIKQKIKECTKRSRNDGNNADTIIKKHLLDDKENEKFDQYFTSVAKEMDEEIHLKMKHEASFNWKHGKKATIQDILKNYQTELALTGTVGKRNKYAEDE